MYTLLSALAPLLLADGGLNGLMNSFKTNWIQPVFIVVVAAIAIPMVIQKQLRALAVFALVATIVALFVFKGEALFGSSGKLTGVANEVVNQVGN